MPASPGVEHHALVIWHGDMALLDPPAIICCSWHPSEDPDLDGEELELEIDLHQRGWRMCECYSSTCRRASSGTSLRGAYFHYRSAISTRHLSLLREQDLPEYEELVYNAAARVPARE